MIRGFEEETAPLSKEEMQLVPVFARSFSGHVGKENAVTSSQIAEGLRNHGRGKIHGARIRKIINHIRIHNIVPRLICSSKGYYISNDIQEVKDYIASLESRAMSIAEVARIMRQTNGL